MENKLSNNKDIHKHLFNYLTYVVLVFSILGLFAIIIINQENSSTFDMQADDLNRSLVSCQTSLTESQKSLSKCNEPYDRAAVFDDGATSVLQTFEFQGSQFNVVKRFGQSSEFSPNFNYYIDLAQNSIDLSYSVINTPIGTADENYGDESLVAVSGNRLYITDSNDNSIKIYELVDLEPSADYKYGLDGAQIKRFNLIDVAVIPQDQTYPVFNINCNKSTCTVYTARHIESGCKYTLDIKTLKFSPQYRCETQQIDSLE